MLAETAAGGGRVRFRGGGTKLGWGVAVGGEWAELGLERLDRTLEHNTGDLTAIFEAGVPLARAQAELAAAGQRLALDPPDAGATLGGVFATGDAGPLRHRYGQPRDLILGIRVALSDGTIARAGGKVIKNVAGYDLAKLFTGAFGTLGLILSVSVRLHPLPDAQASIRGAAADPRRLAQAALALAAAPLELEALDVAWSTGRGVVLAQIAGAQTQRRAERVAVLMREHGLRAIEVIAEDEQLWAGQRAGQRSRAGALVRIGARASELDAILAAVDAAQGALVGRAALGISYVDCAPAALPELLRALPARARWALLDAPPELRASPEQVWGVPEPRALALMRQIKRRFDPAGVCNPGIFVGGI
jgi:glycolate oxidase FAD binding subunit